MQKPLKVSSHICKASSSDVYGHFIMSLYTISGKIIENLHKEYSFIVICYLKFSHL